MGWRVPPETWREPYVRHPDPRSQYMTITGDPTPLWRPTSLLSANQGGRRFGPSNLQISLFDCLHHGPCLALPSLPVAQWGGSSADCDSPLGLAGCREIMSRLRHNLFSKRVVFSGYSRVLICLKGFVISSSSVEVRRLHCPAFAWSTWLMNTTRMDYSQMIS